MAGEKPVLVVGATGYLGGQVVDQLLTHGKPVRALVRDASDPSKLQAKGVEIARGDMLDVGSLIQAMTGVDAVISTAAGYTRNDKNAEAIDTFGNNNLAVAANHAGVRRFVLISILTSDQTPQVPHFWHKKLAEDKLQELGVPFVALRPGAFFDQIVGMRGDPFQKGRIMWFGRKDVPLTFVLTSDLAQYLAAAVDADTADGERIDIGWTRPVSMLEAAKMLSRHIGKTPGLSETKRTAPATRTPDAGGAGSADADSADIKVTSIPTPVLQFAGKVTSRFAPLVGDMASMSAWFETGRYVAHTARQAEVFGPVPTPEEAIARFAAKYGR
ncbi:SDR family oxidoreductase [Paenarthrobacter sp. NPDC090520]|uniref:SDR family oxidoreductase n=1 Tax=Paenarthrobacter sp. NPDC090520 TaxID=3364382 RepID=UPI00382AF567